MIRTALLALAICAPAYAREIDNGGYIKDYITSIVHAAGSDMKSGAIAYRPVRCGFGHKGTCVYPDAELWFHSSGDPRATQP